MAKLGIMLTTGVEDENTRTVQKLAEAALRQGHEVAIFLMDDGVFNIPALQRLAAQGAEVRGAHLTICAYNAEQRGVGRVEGVVWGSQYDWAHIVHDADRVVVFG